MPLIETILHTVVPMCTVICLGGAALLFIRARGNRSRRILGYIMLLWGLAYSLHTVGLACGFASFLKTELLASFRLVGGNFFALILMFYPLEIVRPGWLTWRKYVAILAPYLLLVLVYYGGIRLCGQQVVALHSWQDFAAHAGEFNVWFRFILLLSVAVYVAVLLAIIHRCEVRYRRWCRNNYANLERMDISWLHYYGVGVGAIGVAYLCLLFIGSTGSFLAHNLTVQVFFAYTLYKGLFHENPYPEGFFLGARLAEEEGREEDAVVPAPASAAADTAFLSRLPEYTRILQQWLDETHPYYDKTFKLMDVRQVLPLNRTYLSRVFNEGLGQPFSDLVRDCRMREACRMLRECPDLSIVEVAERCGFTSHSSFHRTFVMMHGGQTPGQYRAGHAGEVSSSG